MIRRLCVLLVLVAFLVSGSLWAAEPQLRFVDNTHVPQKLVVVNSYGTTQFVKELFKIVKLINEENHLPPAEMLKLHIINGNGGDPLSQLGVPLEEAKKYAEVNPKFTSSDIWAQDCMELCAGQNANGQWTQAVFDSCRGRGLGGLPKVLSDLWGLAYFKNPSTEQAHGDYGGNLEVTPFDNVLVSGNTITPKCKAYLEAHGYAGRMFNPDTRWLSVGHIDEYLSFIPSKSSPGGYSIVAADPAYALELLISAPEKDFDTLDSEYRDFLLSVKKTLIAQQQNPDFGKTTREGQFIELNRKLGVIIEKNVGELKAFIRKLTNDPDREFGEVAWPNLFIGYGGSDASGCHAYMPGVVNLTVLRDHLLVPACHFAPYDTIIEGRFRAQGNKVHFIDDEAYHSSMGEIHCGTNVLRSPDRQWLTLPQVRAVQRVKDQFRSLHAPADQGCH